MTSSRKASSAYIVPFFPHQKMPVINIEDLTEKDKAKMEVEQLKKEVKLERQLVSAEGRGCKLYHCAGKAILLSEQS